ncbi:MAG TPA: tail fiber domain-containing protein [Terriglobales bacterium]|jgi:hypothetical protein|nr:tail fiber domain-containing protein [Terriglobales bacterium]
MRRFHTILLLFLFMNLAVIHAQQPLQMASLRPNSQLLWHRVSPSAEKPDGPVLYQIIFRSSAHIGSIPKIGPTYALVDSGLITDNSGNLIIGGLTINGSTGILSFANGQMFALPAGNGDIGGTYPSLTVVGLQGRGVSGAAPANGQILQFNGAQWAPVTLPATQAVWLLGGNSGTGCTSSPCVDFLGTTDNTSLEFRVNNNRALRIEPATDRFYGFSPNVIGGFSGNYVTGAGVGGATIAGGGASGLVNTVSAHFGAVGGGYNNTASGTFASTVAGGFSNTANGQDAVVGGGQRNTSSGFFGSTVAGGNENTASGELSTVCGGQLNLASGDWSTIPGGDRNTASGAFSFAAGRNANTNNHVGAFVWGDDSVGVINLLATADNQFTARAVGGFNFITGIVGFGNPDPAKTVSIAPNSGIITFVAGQTFPGTGTITGVTGGAGLTGAGTSGNVTLAANLVRDASLSGNGGSSQLQVNYAGTGSALTAAHSDHNHDATYWKQGGNSGTDCTTSPCANFLGSTDNSSLEVQVNGQRAYRIEPATDSTFNSFAPNVIGGFSSNNVTALAGGATIAGGGDSNALNSVTDDFGTVGGGSGNQAGNNANGTTDSPYATVGGGRLNTASAPASTVAGGVNNNASGQYSTVTGGANNNAGGDSSTVAGGTSNTASGQDSIVAGGAHNTASGLFSLAAGSHANTGGFQGTFVWGDSSSTADVTATASHQFVARAAGGVIFYTSSDLSTSAQLAAGSGTWSSVSDRNVKDHFAPVDGSQLLVRVLALPITTWNYKSQATDIRHIGPMAQDFFAAFKVGEDERHITEIDEGGVALAAIQGLNQKLEDEVRQKDAQITAQQEQIKALAAASSEQIAALTAEVAAQRQLTQRLLQRVAEIEQTAEQNQPGKLAVNEVHNSDEENDIPARQGGIK